MAESFLKAEGDLFQGIAATPEIEQSGWVGEQEIFLAQPVSLDHVDELVEVEDFGLEILPEEDGIPVSHGFGGDRFFRSTGLPGAYLLKGRWMGEVDRFRLLQQLS